jgi:hypothetical protein
MSLSGRRVDPFYAQIALERTTAHVLIVLGVKGREFKSRQPDQRSRLSEALWPP